MKWITLWSYKVSFLSHVKLHLELTSVLYAAPAMFILEKSNLYFTWIQMNSSSEGSYLECSGHHDVPSPPVLACPHPQESFFLFTIYTCTTVTYLKSPGLNKPCQANAVTIHCKAYRHSVHSKYSICLFDIQFETIFHHGKYNYSKISLFRKVVCTYNFSVKQKDSN